MTERLKHVDKLIPIASLGILVLAVTNAFSRASRKKIGIRDGWQCQESGKRFADGHMIHTAHFDHDRTNPDYNKPYNGRCLSVKMHLQDHVDHIGSAEDIGLTEAQNNWAIQQLQKTDTRTRVYRKTHA